MAFTLGDLPMIAIAVGVGVLVLAYVAKVLSEVDDDMTGDSLDVVLNGSKALTNVGKQLPTVGTIVIAALIIGIIATSFYLGRRS